MNKAESTKQLQILNKVKNVQMEVLGDIALRLHHTAYEENAAVDVTANTSELRERARAVMASNWLVAQMCIRQEGKIPPMNAFSGHTEIVQSSLLLEGDSQMFQAIERGDEHICVHSDKDMIGAMRSAVASLREMVGTPNDEETGN